MKGSAKKLELNYTVETFFYTDKSWVRPDSKSDYLLKHEQLHFDISELYARKLREKLAKVDSSKLNKDSSKYLNKLYEEVAAERVEMQDQFDKETDHSKNKETELKWRLKWQRSFRS